MNNISTKAALFLFDAKSKFGKAKDYLGRKAKSIVKEENGDTNFISIIIILAIVLLVAVAFMIFKDQIIGWFNGTTKLSLIRQIVQQVTQPATNCNF